MPDSRPTPQSSGPFNSGASLAVSRPLIANVRLQRKNTLLCKPHPYCLAEQRFLVVFGVLGWFLVVVLCGYFGVFGGACWLVLRAYLLLSLLGFAMFLVYCSVCPNPSVKRDWRNSARFKFFNQRGSRVILSPAPYFKRSSPRFARPRTCE